MILRGVATVFGRVIDNGVDAPFVVSPGAVRLVGARIPLLREHDPSRPFASTCRGTLLLEPREWGLFFEAEVAAADLEDGVLAGRRTAVSAMYEPLGTRRRGMHAGREVEFYDLTWIREVSVVARGACPATACWPADSPDEWLNSQQRHAKGQWILRNWTGGGAPACATAETEGAGSIREVRPAPKRTAPPSLVALVTSAGWQTARAQQDAAWRSLRAQETSKHEV